MKFRIDKTKSFYKFLEKHKMYFLKSQLRKCGIKKVKIKSYDFINNKFNLNVPVSYTNKTLKEIIVSKNKLKRVKTEKIVENVDYYILFYKSQKEMSNDVFLSLVRYMQENLSNFVNCLYGTFIYNQNIYTIKKENFNGVETYIELKKYVY